MQNQSNNIHYNKLEFRINNYVVSVYKCFCENPLTNIIKLVGLSPNIFGLKKQSLVLYSPMTTPYSAAPIVPCAVTDPADVALPFKIHSKKTPIKAPRIGPII